jgi:2-polyprenyl-6-methoxyphenol hydroxylase-like FAD-dependent oxidoreductase
VDTAHQALLSHVSRDMIHLNKQVVSVDVSADDTVVLKFKDDSVVDADVVLGADGLRSVSIVFNTRMIKDLPCEGSSNSSCS